MVYVVGTLFTGLVASLAMGWLFAEGECSSEGSMRLNLAFGAFAAVLVGGTALADLITDPNDPRSFQGATVGTFARLYFGSDTQANRQLVVDQQLLDDGLFNPAGFTPSTLMHTAWSDGSVSCGTSTDLAGNGSYDYQLGGNAFDAANTVDNRWIQTSSRVGDTVFDLGARVTSAAIFAVIDHGPLPEESIESTVYLSNDLTTWTEARVLRVFLQGFEPNLGILWDGFTYVVGTDSGETFRYASIINGGPGALQHDGDDEINGVLGFNGVPAPSSGAVLALAVAMGGRRSRRPRG